VDLSELQRRFGKVVLRRRLAAKLGQEKFAHEVGVHRTFLSRLEQGKHLPNLALVHKLAIAFGVSMTELMAEVENEETPLEEPPALPRGRPRKQMTAVQQSRSKRK